MRLGINPHVSNVSRFTPANRLQPQPPERFAGLDELWVIGACSNGSERGMTGFTKPWRTSSSESSNCLREELFALLIEMSRMKSWPG